MPLFTGALVRAQTDDSLTKVQNAKKIRIGTNAEYAPFESRDPDTFEIIGFDIDIANYLAEKLGVTVEWVDVGFDVLITQLAAGNFDCVMAAMSVTDERKTQVSFTRWYYQSSQAVLVKTDNNVIKTVEDVNNTSIKAGAQEGTVSADYLRDETNATTLSYETITLAVAALEQGAIDVFLGDYAVLSNVLKTQPNKYKIVDTFSPRILQSLFQNFRSPLDALNAGINELLGSNLENPIPSAKYQEIYKKWFEVDPVFIGGGIDGFPIIGLVFAVSVGILYVARRTRKVKMC